ncbi:MAG: SDR family NAD(P)-dependent oxidoreductase [Rubrobacter sp.]|nr:SDR family NAD(P)-dependent oxidoreductase [Rubrobacter sp.]
MDKNLAGKTAIITGASSGIGEVAAREFARRGASVVIAARNAGKIYALERSISASGGHALAVETDVADKASVENMVDAAMSAFGSVDILVNNAGLGLSGRVSELRVDDLRYVFEVNVIGAVNCVQAALPLMERGGRVINVSSVVGLRAIPMVGGYSASKFALNALSDAMRVELASRGVTVSTVYPGTTQTSFRDNSRRTSNEKRGWRPSGVPPEKVAEKIIRAAEKGSRDVFVSFHDRVFAAAVGHFPGLTDRVLRSWAKG